MRCQICGQAEALVQIQESLGNKMISKHLCLGCAERHPANSGPAIQHEATTAESCPGCGMTLTGMRETGRMGCEICWVTFADEMRELLLTIHGSAVHRGKRVGARLRDNDAENIRAELMRQRKERLLGELDAAVRQERFELAAWLRDQLRELE